MTSFFEWTVECETRERTILSFQEHGAIIVQSKQSAFKATSSLSVHILKIIIVPSVHCETVEKCPQALFLGSRNCQ